MKGLLLKDLYSLGGLYKKNLLIVSVLYAVLALSADMPFFFYMMIWMMGFYSISGIALDQSCQWDRYARTLPVSAGQVVGAKYLVSLIFIGCGTLYSLVLGSVGVLLKAENPTWQNFYFFNGLIAALAGATMALLLPAAYLWGVEKARNSMMIVFAVLFGGSFLAFGKNGLLKNVSMPEALKQFAEEGPEQSSLGAAVAVFLLIAGALLAASYFISRRIYAQKEF